MSQPLVTCITPTFGRFHLLKEMYWSWLQQDYRNKKLLILNDEPGLEIYCDNPDVTIINRKERTKGLGEKRNILWKHVHPKTKYIVTFDDDDLFLPKHITSLVEEAEQFPTYHRIKNKKHIMSKDNVFTGINDKSPFFFGASCFNYPLVKDFSFNEILTEGEDLDWMTTHKIQTKTLDHYPTFVYRQGMGVVHASGSNKNSHCMISQKQLYDRIGLQVKQRASTERVELIEEISPQSINLWKRALNESQK